MSKRIIFLILLAVLGGVIGYFVYIKFIMKEEVPSFGVVKKVETNFETKIFNDQRFLDLKQYVELPIKVEAKGKINPFIKF